MRRFLHNTLPIMAADVVCIVLSGAMALLLRFDLSINNIPEQFLNDWYRFLPWQIVITLALFLAFRMYRYVWRSISAQDVGHIIITIIVAYFLVYVAADIAGIRQPRSARIIAPMLGLMLMTGSRCALRFINTFQYFLRSKAGSFEERIMLIGAGEAGRVLAREMFTSRHANGKICCVIDDNETKWGKYLEGCPIIGGCDRILEAAEKYKITQILFAIPSAPSQRRKEILEICRDTGCRVRTLPAIYELADGQASLSAVKDVRVEDLLGRERVELDLASISEFLRGKTVLVTGGGGSIGSELCRQIVRYEPKELIILDMYENNAYDIQQELRRSYDNVRVVIASVRDKERIYQVFSSLRPDIVFHAAAHKHVPLMEECPSEAVKNNVFGTYHVVRAAEKFGVQKFVMISTDKAVNPTNFMGATKRFCEMILQSRKDSPTEYCAVRFGNVLGSNGSVVPLFKKQIEAGGPVTITDKRIIRYFMTISEAAELVLEAGSIAKQSQIFVLDMGDPVRILDLAENLIRLSGLEPYTDIDIQEIGLRPGEKLYEELLIKDGELSKTANRKIFVEQQGQLDPRIIMADLERLDRAIGEECSDEELRRLMMEIVPSYKEAKTVNEAAIAQRNAAVPV